MSQPAQFFRGLRLCQDTYLVPNGHLGSIQMEPCMEEPLEYLSLVYSLLLYISRILDRFLQILICSHRIQSDLHHPLRMWNQYKQKVDFIWSIHRIHKHSSTIFLLYKCYLIPCFLSRSLGVYMTSRLIQQLSGGDRSLKSHGWLRFLRTLSSPIFKTKLSCIRPKALLRTSFYNPLSSLIQRSLV